MMTKRILIADDHPMCAAALTLAARAVDPLVVVDAVDTFAAAEQVARRERHDLILLDLMLPDVQGLAGLAMIRSLRDETPVAIVSSRDDAATVRRAIALGAGGFVSKASTIDEMIAAIRELLRGGRCFPRDVTADTDPPPTTITGADRIGELSAGQLRVLRAVANGHQNKQIAHDLRIAEPTVKSHLVTIYRKLGVENRTQAVLALRSLDLSDTGIWSVPA